MKRRIERSLLHPRAIGIKESGAPPFTRQALTQWHEPGGFVPIRAHAIEIKIRRADIHHQARSTACGVMVAQEQRCDGVDISRCLECVKVVGVRAQPNSRRTNFFTSLAIAHAHASPIVALEHHERPGKSEAG